MLLNLILLRRSAGRLGVLAGVAVLAALGQQPRAGQDAEKKIVEQFFPKELLDEAARLASRPGGHSSKDVIFMAADLNAAGRKDFLVAVYNVYA